MDTKQSDQGKYTEKPEQATKQAAEKSEERSDLVCEWCASAERRAFRVALLLLLLLAIGRFLWTEVTHIVNGSASHANQSAPIRSHNNGGPADSLRSVSY